MFFFSAHNGGNTKEANYQMAEGAASQIVDIFEGRPFNRVVNPEIFPAFQKRLEAILGKKSKL